MRKTTMTMQHLGKFLGIGLCASALVLTGCTKDTQDAGTENADNAENQDTDTGTSGAENSDEQMEAAVLAAVRQRLDEPIGAVLRVPAQGELRDNFHAGGSPHSTDFSPRDREICAAVGPWLRAQGLFFAGLDVIGDYLTEINVTSPTGLQEIDRFDGVSLERQIWDAIETRLANGPTARRWMS